jgi:hypothetical protein
MDLDEIRRRRATPGLTWKCSRDCWSAALSASERPVCAGVELASLTAAPQTPLREDS